MQKIINNEHAQDVMLTHFTTRLKCMCAMIDVRSTLTKQQKGRKQANVMRYHGLAHVFAVVQTANSAVPASGHKAWN
jgi:hypothetical protein